MAEFNGTKITEYKDGRDTATGTLARGSTFNNEFNRLYANDNYLKDKTDDLQAQITGLIDGAPEALNTLNELAAALNDDENLGTNVLARIYASQQRNLVYNHDFRLFSNQEATISSWYSYKHPDGYIYTDPGTDGKIGYDTSLECCKFQTSSDGTGARIFKQALHEIPKWGKLLKGSTVTLKAFVKGANATVKLTDGVTVQSFALQNTGAVEEITLQLAVSSSATELTFSIESSVVSNTIEVYKVYANRGLYAIETLPYIEEIWARYYLRENSKYKNITAKLNVSNPNYQVDIEWDSLYIEGILSTSGDFTLDITASGLLGLDTGSEAVSTWYYLWAIAKTDGTVSVILSASATSPTMPLGYTLKRLVSMVRNNSSGNFVNFVQENERWSYVDNTTMKTSSVVIEETLNCSQWIPDKCRKAFIRLKCETNGTTASTAYATLYQYINGSYVLLSNVVGSTATNPWVSLACAYDLIACQSRQIKYSTNAPGAATIAIVLSISYFEVELC